ncbi:hypothetical protein [Stetteria hydrogenophila]
MAGRRRLRLEEHLVSGRYRVELVYDGDELIGAYVDLPAFGRVYIPRRETILLPRLSKKVKKFLEQRGFRVL